MDRVFEVHSELQPPSRGLSLRERLAVSQQRGTGPRLLPGAGPGPAAAAHLLSGARHLEPGAEAVQPFPLLVPPQALQVLPQHLDDLERGAGLSRSGSSLAAPRALPVEQKPNGAGVKHPGTLGLEAAPAQRLFAAVGSARGALTCFTSSRTASRHWEWPSCRMFSFDLARCRGVRPARSRASTRAPAGAGQGKHRGHEGKGGGQRGREHIPPRSRVVMTGTWLVQAAEEEEQGPESPGHQGLALRARREGAGL